MYYIAVILCLLMYLLMIINDIVLKLCYVYITVILSLLMLYLLMIINDIFLKLCYVLYRGDFVFTDVFIDDNK